MRLVRRWHESTFKRSVALLDKRDQQRIIAVCVFQVLLSILDLLGVIAFGLIATLSIGTSDTENQNITRILQILGISDLDRPAQLLVIAIGAGALLTIKTIFSVLFTRKVLYFLSRKGAEISANMISRLLSQNILKLQEKSSLETMYAVTAGVTTVTLNVLAPSVVLISDISLLIIMIVGLLFVDAMTTAFTVLFFSIIVVILYRFMHVLASNLGKKSTELNIASYERIMEVIATFREAVVRNRQDFYAKEIGSLRMSLSNTSAEINFLPYVSKYVIETSIVIGALALGISQIVLVDPKQAAATIAIFLAAGTRIAPAVLRVQQSLVAIKTALSQSLPTLDLIDTFKDFEPVTLLSSPKDSTYEKFVPELEFKDVSFTYPNATSMALSNISFRVPIGSSVAFVGPSGGGKSTLIDLLLGILPQESGEISVSSMPPLLAIQKWPGEIGFVPQDVVIAIGTIRQNVALGFSLEEATNDRVVRALRIANLMDFVDSLPNGIDTQVGERGAKLSGGQRQRLGIARAMFTQPKLLVLDEATSSLDGDAENEITKAISALHGEITVVLVAHRLSTVRAVDNVAYISSGKIIAMGAFDEVRRSVPDFDHQAKLMEI